MKRTVLLQFTMPDVPRMSWTFGRLDLYGSEWSNGEQLNGWFSHGPINGVTLRGGSIDKMVDTIQEAFTDQPHTREYTLLVRPEHVAACGLPDGWKWEPGDITAGHTGYAYHDDCLGAANAPIEPEDMAETTDEIVAQTYLGEGMERRRVDLHLLTCTCGASTHALDEEWDPDEEKEASDTNDMRGKWACNRCGLINPNTNDTCNDCGYGKGQEWTSKKERG